jgi:hypothetical protein
MKKKLFFSEMSEKFDISETKCIYLANSVLLTKYFSDDQMKNEIGRASGRFGPKHATACACGVLVGRPEGKMPLVRPRHLWDDSIKVDVQGLGRGGRDWIDIAQDRDMWQVLLIVTMNEPSGSIQYGKFLDYLRTCQLHKKGLCFMNLVSK